jgi:hypothetical protein
MDCPRCQEKGIKAVIRVLFCEKPRRLGLHCFREVHDDRAWNSVVMDHHWNNEECNQVMPDSWERLDRKELERMGEKLNVPVMLLEHAGDDDDADHYKMIYCRTNGTR